MQLTLVETKKIGNRKRERYVIGSYRVVNTTYDDGCKNVRIYLEVEEGSRYTPAIYVNDNFEGDVLGFAIQTTSYGELSVEETKKMIAALNEAVEVVEILTAKFVK